MNNVILDGIIFSLQKYGGISVYFRELLSALSESDLQFQMSLELPVLQDFSDLDPSMKFMCRDGRYMERLRSCRTVGQTGVFHSSYYRTPSSKNRLASVVTVHDFISERFNRNMKGLAHSIQKRRAIRQAQAIICISQSTKSDLIKYAGVRNGQDVYVVPNGVSESFRPLSLEPLTKYILFVGERRFYKNFKLAAEALAFLPGMQLLAVGGQPDTSADVAGLADDIVRRIRFLGHVSEQRLNELYNQALCLVYPSAYEGFGIPVAEAMKAGCPVVCIDTPAVVETGGAALEIAFEPSGREIAASVTRLLEPTYRQAKVQLGLKFSTRYSWTLCHEKTIEIYRTLL